MFRTRIVLFFTVAIVTSSPQSTTASETPKSANTVPATDAARETKFLLRYRFAAGDIIRFKVVHQAAVRTTIDGTSSTAETVSTSIKAWKVQDVNDKGHITFVHSVEQVDMKNDVSSRETVRYNSLTDKEPPPEFNDVAKRVGIALTKVVIDPSGKILRREDLAPGSPTPTQMTLPLPHQSVPVGHVWSLPFDIDVKLRSGAVKKVKARQRFELLSVEDELAEIGVETQILSPIDDPELEAQLVQRQSNGIVKFDISAGVIVSQQIDLDRRIVGYPNPKSSMHYRTRFTETLLKAGERTAAKPK